MRIRLALLFVTAGSVVLGQNPRTFFDDSQLLTTGVYYYPEHWDPSQWDRDLKRIADMGCVSSKPGKAMKSQDWLSVGGGPSA
jgi:beta-galactosidase